jgi:hypothetical protein
LYDGDSSISSSGSGGQLVAVGDEGVGGGGGGGSIGNEKKSEKRTEELGRHAMLTPRSSALLGGDHDESGSDRKSVGTWGERDGNDDDGVNGSLSSSPTTTNSEKSDKKSVKRDSSQMNRRRRRSRRESAPSHARPFVSPRTTVKQKIDDDDVILSLQGANHDDRYIKSYPSSLFFFNPLVTTLSLSLYPLFYGFSAQPPFIICPFLEFVLGHRTTS